MENKKNRFIFKILIGIILLLTILMGFQAITLGAMSLGILTSSLYKLLANGSIPLMKVIYISSGISVIIASGLLFWEVYLKRNNNLI